MSSETTPPQSGPSGFHPSHGAGVPGDRRSTRRTEGESWPGAVLLIDLDDFAALNDEYGRRVADEILSILEARLAASLRRGDTVERGDGDEFLIHCHGVVSKSEAFGAAERLLAKVQEPLRVGGRTLRVGASVGVVAGGHLDRGAPEVREQVARALFSAKAGGRGGVAVAVDAGSELAACTPERVQAGIDAGEFVVHYQPIVEIATGAAVAFEALVRWEHPQEGLLVPERFLAEIREVGCLPALGAHVLRTVGAQVQQWSASGASLPVHVNVGPTELADASFMAALAAESPQIVLEVSGAAFMSDATRAVLALLREQGRRIVIDDIVSSPVPLTALGSLPADMVVLDRRVTARIDDSAEHAMVEAVVAAAHAAGIDVNAKGIETEEQLLAVTELGCEVGQGFYFARPQPAGVVGALARGRMRWQRPAA